MTTKTLTDIEVTLVGEDGNAFAVLGKVIKALKKGGREDLVEKFTEEATNGNYNHLLNTCRKYVQVR